MAVSIYKTDTKLPKSLRTPEDNTQTDSFWFLFFQVNTFWDQQDFTNAKEVIDKMSSTLNCESRESTQLDFTNEAEVRNTNIIISVLGKTAAVLQMQPQRNFSNLLSSLLALLINLCSQANIMLKMFIEAKPLKMLIVLLKSDINDIFEMSTDLISLLLTAETSEDDIRYLAFFLLNELNTTDRPYPQVVKYLKILNTFCRETEQLILADFVPMILKTLPKMFQKEYSFYFVKSLVIIVYNLQNRNFNIKELNSELFDTVINVLYSPQMRDMHHDVIRFLTLILYQDNNSISFIMPHINRIIQIFNTLSYGEIHDLCALQLLQNIIVDEPSVVGLLLQMPNIECLLSYLSQEKFEIRYEAAFMGWNMLNVGSIENISGLLENKVFVALTVESLEINTTEHELQKFAFTTMEKLVVKLGYTEHGENAFLDLLFDKVQKMVNEAVEEEDDLIRLIYEHFASLFAAKPQ